MSDATSDDAVASRVRQAAAEFTVINYDRRGRGLSGDTPPYQVEREIEDIAALITVPADRHSCSAVPPVPYLHSGQPQAVSTSPSLLFTSHRSASMAAARYRPMILTRRSPDSSKRRVARRQCFQRM